MSKVPMNECARLEALKRFNILDTPPEAVFDDLTALAAQLCETPIALIGLIDDQRQWFKSKLGWDVPEIPRSVNFCDETIGQGDRPLVIPDTSNHRTVIPLSDPSDLPIRAYAGITLTSSSGFIIGTLCVMDHHPRPFTTEQIQALQRLGRQIMVHLESRAKSRWLEQTIVRQKQVEQDLHQNNQRFRQLLQKIQQTQAQLIQAEKMSGLGQMVAGIAHEINNPVSFVYGNLTYVNRYIQDLFGLLKLYHRHYPQPEPEIQQRVQAIDFGFLSEDLPKILSSMQAGTERIRQIIMSLRNFSRLDETEKKFVDIHQGLESTLLILHHRLKETTSRPAIQVITAYGDLPEVECYAGQMNQVFMNLLNNAIDALNTQFDATEPPLHPSPTQLPTLWITTQVGQIPSDSGHIPSVMIRIKDNGVGIPESIREHIFEPFFTTKPVGQGTGLGLSVCYQIVVDRHIGYLTFTSSPGEGSEFWVEIPVQWAAVEAASSPSKALTTAEY